MTLPRTEVVAGLTNELAAFSALIRSLDAESWAAPSRCDGWSVADVAAHVTGQFADVVAFRLDGLGTPEVTARQVAERRGRTTAELADELDEATKLGADLLAAFDDDAWAGPIPGGLAGTLGFGVESLWFDAWLHADDMRAPLGLAPVTGDGIRVSLSHIAQVLTNEGYPPATLALDGAGTFPVSGGGPAIAGDPFAFILAATGRGEPAAFGLDETVNIYRA